MAPSILRLLPLLTFVTEALGVPGLPNLHPRDACAGNTATTRDEWCDYSIDTDYTTTVPDTGVTREYWFELQDVTVAPDGVSRPAITINGSIPGPTIFADWGDTVTVHVNNALTTSLNGTSIHFHGIRQNFTNQNDGVVSITQCPTPPGDSITYTWRATQYGSTWYHSHFSLQAWEGVFGGIVINGPATANYDSDLGVVFLNDWGHMTADQLYAEAQTTGPPDLENALINGTNTYEGGGSRLTVPVAAGSSYRLRLVNGAIDSHFKFMIDNHTLQVIAADLVPIRPFSTNILNIGIGQRYDVIVTADQAAVADRFWMRAIPQSSCSSVDEDQAKDVKAIVTYVETTASADPTTDGWSYEVDECVDETDNLVPHLAKTVGGAGWDDSEVADFTTVGDLFKWTLNSTTMLVEWSNPTLAMVVDGETAFETSDAVLALPTPDEWVYLAIDTTLALDHPIHLHGHDFFILAQGTGDYTSDVALNLDNPPRRDTALLPASGYLVLAWQADNPGAWLMHCHIGWHTSEGFGLQWIERYDEIAAITDQTVLSDTCSAWSDFQATQSIEQEDSGV